MRNIYIVDDEDPLRASLLGLLSIRQDQVVRTFCSGDAFLDQVDELDPGALLLDIHMPGVNGMDVLTALAPLEGRFVTIILTGQGDVPLAVRAMQAGAVDFLEKPYEPARLLAAVERAFAHFERGNAAQERVVAARTRIERLSSREREVLKGLIDGRPNKLIAQELKLSPRTVEIYRSNLMDKLDVRSLSEALRIAFAAGLVPAD